MSRIVLEAGRLLIPVAILAAGFLGYRALGGRSRPPLKQVEKDRPAFVQTVQPQSYQGPLNIEVEGAVTPYRDVQVSAEVPGRVTFKAPNCRAGMYVHEGDVLIRLDDRDYQFEVRRLQKELQQGKDSLVELQVESESTTALIALAEEDLELQGKEVARIRELVQRKAAAISDIEKARRAEIAAHNTLTTLQNQLRMQQSRKARMQTTVELTGVKLEQAQLDAQRTVIKAPLDGLIVQEPVEENSYVQGGAPLFVIEDTSRMEVRCSLRVEQLHWLWSQERLADGEPSASADLQIPPAPATILYELGDRQYAWRGVLSRFEGAGIDERTRTAPCRVLVAEPRDVRLFDRAQPDIDEAARATTGPRALMRGMYVTVRIHAEPKLELLKIPELALRPGGRVWLARDGKFATAKVQVARTEWMPSENGGSAKRFALIRVEPSGIREGDRLIVSPLSAPQPGMAVEELEKS